MWANLHTVYVEKNDQSVQIFLDQFINEKMELKESITDHISKIILLIQWLKNIDLE